MSFPSLVATSCVRQTFPVSPVCSIFGRAAMHPLTQLLGLPESLDVWGTFYFGIHALVISLYLVCQVVPAKKVRTTVLFFASLARRDGR